MNKVIHEIRKYKELKADIRNIELKLEELEEDIGITEQPQGERTGVIRQFIFTQFQQNKSN